jgi:hypothetical protein
MGMAMGVAHPFGTGDAVSNIDKIGSIRMKCGRDISPAIVELMARSYGYWLR